MRFAKLLYLLAGIGLLFVVLGDTDLADVWARVSGVGIAGIAAIVGVYFLAFLGDSVSWSLILTSVPTSLTWFRRTFMVRLAGEAFNNVLPAAGFGGEPVKAVILKRRYGVSYREATASIVMARTINMIALIGFLFIGFLFMAQSHALGPALKSTATAGLALLSIGTILMFAIQRFRVSSWVTRKFTGARWAERPAGIFVTIEDMDDRFVTFYTAHRWRLTLAIILAFANWVLGVAEIYLTFLFLGHEISWADAWMIEALAQMVRSAVFFIPLALGAQEGAFLLISTAITGVPTLGIACAAVRRIRELLWIVLGLGAAAFYPTTLKAEAGRD